MRGKLANAVVTENTDQLLYTAPAACRKVEFQLNALNKSASLALLQVAIGTGAGPVAGQYVEYGVNAEANGGVVIRTGKLSPGEKIWVRSPVAGVDVRLDGDEICTV